METRLLERELKLVKVNYAHSRRRRVILESKVKDLTAYKDGLQHQVSFAYEHIERGLHYKCVYSRHLCSSIFSTDRALKVFVLNLDSSKFESAITDLCFTATTCDLNDYRAKAGVFAYTQALAIVEHGFESAVHSFFMLISRFFCSGLHASTLKEAAYDFRIHNRFLFELAVRHK